MLAALFGYGGLAGWQTAAAEAVEAAKDDKAPELKSASPKLARYNTKLYPVDIDGKWGFIDSAGKLVVAAQYEAAHVFCEGLATVKTNGKYGYIDENNKMVIAPQFRWTLGFREGLAWVDDIQSRSGFSGFIDRSGTLLFSPPPEYRAADGFREGLAVACPPMIDRDDQTETKWGFINRTGAWEIKPRFEYAWGFEEGLAAVKENGKWGFINNHGEYVLAPKYDSACYFSEGVAKVKLNGKDIFIGPDGAKLFDKEYEEAGVFSEGLASVKIDGKWGFIDKTGALVIKPAYDDVSSFMNGLASIKLNGKYGFIDQQGEVIVPPTYGYAHFFLGELAQVTFHPERGDGSWLGYVNRSGKVVWEPKPPDYAPNAEPSTKKSH